MKSGIAGLFAAGIGAAAAAPPPRPAPRAPAAGGSGGAPRFPPATAGAAPRAGAAAPAPPRPPPPPRGAPAYGPVPQSGRAAPPPRGAPGSTSVISVGCSFDTMYMVPFVGSTADRPQFDPPLWPGISIVPFKLGGVNKPSLRKFLKAARTDSRSASGKYGLM